MKKLAVLLFAAIVIISSLIITSASASSVTISFIGEENVKRGTSYSFHYTLTANEIFDLTLSIGCENAKISGKINPEASAPSEASNRDIILEGDICVTISDIAIPDEKIIITASYSYNNINDGITSKIETNKESYILTVVSDEVPTPSPIATPNPEPPTATTSEPTTAPSQESAATSTHNISPRPSNKPLTSASPANPTISPPQASLGLETAVLPSTTSLLSSSDTLCAELDTMSQYGTITVSMDSAASSPNTLSAQTLAALKAKQGTLVINFNGYSCAIDGTKLGTSLTEPINLNMNMTKDALVSDAADGHDVYQLHFAQIGDLPGCLTYSFIALESLPGDALYLYCYHAASGLAEYKRSIYVDDDDCATFQIYEGGSYFVTASLITDNPATGQTSEKDDTTASHDIWMIVVPVTCIVFAIVAFFVILRRKGFLKKQSYKARH